MQIRIGEGHNMNWKDCKWFTDPINAYEEAINNKDKPIYLRYGVYKYRKISIDELKELVDNSRIFFH